MINSYRYLCVSSSVLLVSLSLLLLLTHSHATPVPVNPVNVNGHPTLRATSRHLQWKEQESECPTPPGNDTFSLSRDLIQKASTAAILSEIVTFEISGCIADNIEENKKRYERFDGWWNLQDQAVVAKDNGTCYAVFMGTNPANLLDELQNINLLFDKVPESDCLVRAGYKNAYFNSYYAKMKAAVKDCLRSCVASLDIDIDIDIDSIGSGSNISSQICPLVLHGHSQGGSIASIAAIDLRRYNPITITFGTPRTIKKCDWYPCTALDTSKQLRFINTLDGSYDDAVMNDLLCPDQVGIALLLDNVNYPIANVGLDNDDIREPVDSAAHNQTLYTIRIKELAESNCFPIPATAWPTGHYCNYGDECQSGSCSSSLVCT